MKKSAEEGMNQKDSDQMGNSNTLGERSRNQNGRNS